MNRPLRLRMAALLLALGGALLPASTAVATAQARGYWLVLSSERDGTDHPYAIRSDGARLTPLVPPSAETLHPAAVSRDGSTIAYVDSFEGAHEGVYVSRANGAGLHRVLQGALTASLSPNGKMLAFMHGWPSRLDVIGTDGRGRRRLGSGSLEPVDWSPNGKALVLTPYTNSSRGSIVVRPLQGKERVVLRRGWGVGAPKWSPDGKWIAYALSFRENRGNGLYVVRPDGTGRRRVAKGQTLAYSWSPDSRRLAFTGGVTRGVGIVGVDGRGFRAVRLRAFDLIGRLMWSPGAGHLIFSAARRPRKDGESTPTQVWIVGVNGRGLRLVTKMVGSFDLVGWTRVAPAHRAAAPLLPSERVVATDAVRTVRPVTDLSADGSRVAFIVRWTAAECDHVVVWTPSTRALNRFARPAECTEPIQHRTYDVQFAGSRAAWVSSTGCGNFCDLVMQSATLGQPSPRPIAYNNVESGTDFDFHLGGDGELLVFNDEQRLVRIGGGSQRCQDRGGAPAVCAILRRDDHAASADSVSNGRIAIRERDAVAVVDEHGALVRVFPFAPDEIKAARLDGNHLVVASSSVLEVYDVTSGMGEVQRTLPSGYTLADADGGIAVLKRENRVMLMRLDDGRSFTLTPGKGPVFAELEEPGLYYSYATEDGGGRVVLLPRAEVVRRLLGP
jgi:Tol biopolymer transport system component